MTEDKDSSPSIDKHWVLEDEMLATPEHDEMVLWLLDEKNAAESFKLDPQDVNIASEVPIVDTKKRYIIGYWDVVITPSASLEKKYEAGYNPTRFLPIYIEVKPKIYSFGATLRQINKYLVYTPDAKHRTWVFTKDGRFKEAFEKQKVLTLLYKGGA